METWKQDLRYGFRMFLRTPGWTLVIVLSLAIGIGANTAIFSLVNAILLAPLPFHDPEKLVIVWEEASFVGFPKNTPAPANYADWNSQNHVFTGMAAVASTSFNLTGSGEPLRLEAFSVTANLFPLLGVKPALGRTFLPEEDRPGGNQVVVISHDLWQNRFGDHADVIGKDILLNNSKYSVIGVMPKGFQFLDPEIDVWSAIRFTSEDLQNRSGHYLQVVARLKPNVSFEQANAEMKNIMKRISQQYPDEAGPLGITLIPLRTELVGDTRQQLILLSIAVGCVLLIACANIANLLLSSGVSRKKEIALRAALGAGRGRIVRQLLMESMILSVAGGILGLVLGIASFSFLRRLIPMGMMLSTELSIDGGILLFTLGLSLLTGLFFGLVPSLQVARTDLNSVLKTGGQRAGIGDGKIFRNLMVVAETAFAVVLLVGAALLIQTIYRLQKQDIGFRAENVLRTETRLPRSQYDTPEKRIQFYEQVLQRVENLGGVISAGYSTAVPLDWKGGTNGYTWEGKPLRRGEVLDANHREVSARLLQTLGVPLVQGHYFDGKETAQSMSVAIVNEAMARGYSDRESVIGKRFQLGGDTRWFTVIGVVRNIRNMGLDTEPKAEMYLPMSQAFYGYAFYAPKELLVRTTSDPTKIANDIRQIIRAVDPNLPVSNVMTLQFVVDREITGRRITMILLAVFAGVALLLATIGIYGVLSYFVNQQIPELGVRLALGAQPVSILFLILKRGLALAVAGISLGIAGAIVLTGIMQSLLFEVSARDPVTFVVAIGALLLTAIAACALPGRQAMKIDPLTALRSE